jgi:excisionase family DNA binding protein
MVKRKEVELLTTKEVANRLGAAESSVRLWCDQQKFPNAKQYGRVWLIPASDLGGFVKRDPGRPPKAGAEPSAKKARKGAK